jgi:hypothetical protein
MAASFETSDQGATPTQQPIRVATRREYIFESAKEMAEDMKGWELVSADAETLLITCTKNGGALGGKSTITITIEGSEEVPSTTVNTKCVTEGGMLARPKAIVESYMKLLFRRVC